MNYVALELERVPTVLRALEVAATLTDFPKDKRAYAAAARAIKRESSERTQTVFGGYWHLSDLDGMFEDADGNEIKLTPEQQRQTMLEAFRMFDAGCGINWDSIKAAYYDLKERGEL